jgi:Protein of unknown function (DUF3631)/Bifunctional DNA primase/polymerase, N-terminal
MSSLGEAAIDYAKRGWSVFPVAARGKVPLLRRGMLEATADEGLVSAWWEQRPSANIGVSCGASGLLVVDLDGDDAVRAWADLAAHHGGHRKTLVARTGKGYHLYFAGQGRSSAGRIAPKVDTRSGGGYVIAPPSVHGSGARYRWLDPAREPVGAPEWLVEVLASGRHHEEIGERTTLPDGVPFTPYGRSALEGIRTEMACTVEGERNSVLNALAYRCGRLSAAGQLGRTGGATGPDRRRARRRPRRRGSREDVPVRLHGWPLPPRRPRGAAVSELAAVLDAVEVFIRRFVVVSTTQTIAGTLWIAHTHALEAFDTTPYLALTSAEKRSGKSRLLEVLELLVREPLQSVNMSDAVLFRVIADRQPTLLLDEADTIFGGKTREREEFRGMLNAGWRRGAYAYRMGGSNNRTLEGFPVYCPKAFAGIGSYLPDTLADRSITVRLERRTREEVVERFRRREAVPKAETLRDALAAAVEPLTDELRAARPRLPDELDDRAEDYWEPLLAIADLAGGGWPERARSAAVELSSGAEREDDSLSLRLLTDVRTVFSEKGAASLKTSALIDELGKIEESPWGDWYGKPISAQSLSKLLRPYRIKTMPVWVDEKTVRGYKREQFVEAWNRYLPVVGVRGVRSVRSKAPSHAAPNAPNTPNAQVVEPAQREWLARDGVWRSFETDPPLAAEIVETRGEPS